MPKGMYHTPLWDILLEPLIQRVAGIVSLAAIGRAITGESNLVFSIFNNAICGPQRGTNKRYVSLGAALVFNRHQRCSESITKGISASKCRSDIARPAASANLMLVSDNKATSQRMSSSISKHTCSIVRMFSMGIGLRETNGAARGNRTPN